MCPGSKNSSHRTTNPQGILAFERPVQSKHCWMYRSWCCNQANTLSWNTSAERRTRHVRNAPIHTGVLENHAAIRPFYQWPWLRNRLIGGTDSIYIYISIYKAYFSGLCKGISPAKYGLIWYSTSILRSWNSHWFYITHGFKNHCPHW